MSETIPLSVSAMCANGPSAPAYSGNRRMDAAPGTRDAEDGAWTGTTPRRRSNDSIVAAPRADTALEAATRRFNVRLQRAR